MVRLGEADVVEELARMLGGDPDDEAALRHAEALQRGVAVELIPMLQPRAQRR